MECKRRYYHISTFFSILFTLNNAFFLTWKRELYPFVKHFFRYLDKLLHFFDSDHAIEKDYLSTTYAFNGYVVFYA